MRGRNATRPHNLSRGGASPLDRCGGRRHRRHPAGGCGMSWGRGVVFASALAAIAGASVPAFGASLLELNFWLSGPRYDAVVPTCEDPAALGRIQARFSEKESGFWNSSLQIVQFE